MDFATSEYQVEVTPDCTTKTFSDGNLIASGVVVDDGNQPFFMSRSEGYTLYGVTEKIHQ